MKKTISDYFAGILKNLGIDNAVIVVDVPENPVHGDYTTNVAMINAGHFKAPPMIVAQKIVDQIILDQKKSPSPWFGDVKIAPPGFINLFLSEGTFSTEVTKVLKEKERYGAVYYNHVTQKVASAGGDKNKDQNDFYAPRKKNQEAIKKSDPEAGVKTTSEQPIDSTYPADAEKEGISQQTPSRGKKKTIMVEFAHPNTHKAFHIGHLRNITTGESIVRLLESQGYHVIRANYQGDVGMHIAKALYALLNVSPYKEEVHSVTGIKNRVEFLGKAYAAGSKAFEDDEKVKALIKDYNYFVYASAERFAAERGLPKPSTDYLSFVGGDKSIVDTVYAMWKETRQWSLDYFDTIYKRVYTHYDRFYFESECLTGVDTAKAAVKKKILEESDGAIIFRGKEYGIDTRVFVNSLGLPTYEAKELALAPMEASEFGELQRLIHCVGPEQASFFKVTFKVEELLGFLKPDVPYHLAYGWVKLKHGKMSSRLGNVVLGEWLIDEVKKEVKNIIESNILKQNDIDKETVSEALAIGAIKYAFLKVSTPSEIAFDLKESVNINGDSGPYLMYTYARCKSVMRKAEETSDKRPASTQRGELETSKKENESSVASLQSHFNPEERAVIRFIIQFADVVADSANRYAPNTLCTYLFQLAQAFNLFYAKHQIVETSDKRPASTQRGELETSKKENESPVASPQLLRLAITSATAQVLKNGLYLLGINTLERM